MPRQAPTVTAKWLLENRTAPDVRIVDATWVPPFLVARKTGRDQYNSGHIPGAVFFDIDDIAAKKTSLPHMMPDPILFSSRVRKLGIGDGHHIIIYDNNSFFAAARVWWMFRAMGHEDVSVLDGGYKAWLSASGDIEDLPPKVTERHFTARQRADLIKDQNQVKAASENETASILDARSTGRFDGTEAEPRPDLPSGHIPGSANIPYGDLLTDNGHLKSAEDLKPLLEPYLDGPIITSCGSGVSAAVIALALARLGHWDAAIYDGAWSEWAADPDNPIAHA